MNSAPLQRFRPLVEVRRSSERLVGCCKRLPLAFLVAAEVPAQHHRGFPARDQHHVALTHAAAQGYTGECAPQVVETRFAEFTVCGRKLTVRLESQAIWNRSTARS